MEGYQIQGRLAGEIIAYRFADTPAGWLELDGSTVDVDDYPVLGAKYGGSPGGTFNLDDYRDVPLWGSTGIETGGDALGDVVGADTANISHTHTGTTGLPSTTTPTNLIVVGNVAGADHTHDITTNAGGNSSFNRRPKRALVRWLIRAY
ncbi:MAG: phage tail protein [Gammaproteobacteria bacterium]